MKIVQERDYITHMKASGYRSTMLLWNILLIPLMVKKQF